MFLIDDRAGSNDLARYFDEGTYELTRLGAGDVCFVGNGPDCDWVVGLEHKKVGDLVNCIKDGRFAGTQLPEMMQLYDVCFLLVEGNYQPDYRTHTHNGDYALWVPFGGGRGIRYGLSYKAFDNFLNSVAVFSALAGKPCIVKKARDKSESKQVITDLYEFFQKPWDDHRAMSMHDRTKMSRVQREIELMQVEPTDADYPKQVLQKALYQIKGVGWDVAATIANGYGTLENVLKASQKEFEGLDRVGKGLAERIFRTLHGYDDPTRKLRKRSMSVDF